jgi:hypothetical protein
MTVIQNRTARVDREGKIIDCHDGCLQFFAGRYFHYGTRYGTENGYTAKNRFVCYSSADLETWTNHGELIPGLPDAIYFRPYVRYCAATGKYVLWFNQYDRWKGTTDWAAGDGPTPGFYTVATADKPEGPFEVVRARANVPEGVGDENLFVDADGAGYLIYTRIKDAGVMIYFQMRVARLTADFLDVAEGTDQQSAVIDREVEAPALFRRGEFYYALMGHPCCFCPGGSDVRVYRSTSPLGPYELRGNINTPAGAEPAVVWARKQKYIVQAQTTDVAAVRTARRVEYLWLGDRWESAADGVKGHDLQYWGEPLEFDEKGDILPLRFVEEWRVELGSE